MRCCFFRACWLSLLFLPACPRAEEARAPRAPIPPVDAATRTATAARTSTRTVIIADAAIPRPAPIFRLRALDNSIVRLDELAYPGKDKTYAPRHPVVLNFFRRDCPPCVKQLAELRRLHEVYGPRGLKVVMIVLLEEQNGRERLDEFLKTEPLPFTVLIDEIQLTSKKYLGDPITVPSTFLIDRQGTVRAQAVGRKDDLVEALGSTAFAAAIGGDGRE